MHAPNKIRDMMGDLNNNILVEKNVLVNDMHACTSYIMKQL